MEKYTIETLKIINQSYDMKHGITQSDVDKVNKLIAIIEGSRRQDLAQAGDMIQFTNQFGEYYPNAHIERIRDGQLYVCENPYSPFVELMENKEGIQVNTSGGAWSYLPLNLQYVGKQKKLFVAWGHDGACANGAINFFAEVSVWEYTEGIHEFTTKTYDKFFLTIRNDVESYDYKYLISNFSGNHIAFHTNKEYKAWLKTFFGVEKEGPLGNTRIIWTYKQKSKFIPLEEYLKIKNAVVDSELCNGTIQECKRVYKDTTVTTYFPFQHNLIELKGVKAYMRVY